jgi:signal transduction histidine kinase
MTRARWRLRTTLVLGAIAALAPVLFIVEHLAERGLRRAFAGSDPVLLGQAIESVRSTFFGLAAGTLVLAVLLAWMAGAPAVRQLKRMRASTLARARGERGTPMTRSHVAELDALGSAIDLLSADLERRLGELAVERDELTLLVTSVNEGILQIGADLRIVHANPAARALLGLREDERGQPLSAIVRNAELRALLEGAAQGRSQPAREINIDDRRLLVAAKPLHEPDAPDRPAGAVVAFTDFTEIRRLEGVRRDFVANVSHELKTPLTSIRGYVETLLSDDLPLDMQRQFLDVIRKNAERLHGIVDDLLDLSRLESGGWRPAPRDIDALELVHEVWNGMQDRLGSKHVDFLPTGDSTAVFADPGGLRQVLSNLLDNAIRYTPSGGSIRVRIQRANGGPAPNAAGRVIIEIEDSGIGIPGDALPRIFERFYRVDPARSRAEGGTGLGLSIVKHLVESMGGDVEARSALGKGSTFAVRLPASAAAIPRRSAAETAP